MSYDFLKEMDEQTLFELIRTTGLLLTEYEIKKQTGLVLNKDEVDKIKAADSMMLSAVMETKRFGVDDIDDPEQGPTEKYIRWYNKMKGIV